MLKIFLLLFLLFPLSTPIISHDYYRNIFKFNTQQAYSDIEIYEHLGDLFLYTSTPIPANQTIISIANDNILSGCQYYPYKHILLKLLSDYFNQTPKQIPHFEIYIHTISFVYELMYFAYVDKEVPYLPALVTDVKTYDKITESEFFKFTLNQKQKDFLEEITDYDDKHINYTYTQNEENIMKKVNIEDTSLKIVTSAYNYVRETLRWDTKISKGRKDLILSFLSNRRLFYKIYYYVNKYSFPITMNQYITINKQFKSKDINEYNKRLQNQKTPIKNCFILSPLLSLIRININGDPSKTKPMNFDFNIKDNHLLLTSKHELPQGEIFKELTMPNANALFDFGYNKNTNYTLKKSLLTFPKDYFGNDKRRNVCHLSYCEGIGADKYSYKGEFLFSSNNINPMLLNLGRLIALDEDDIVNVEESAKVFERRQFISVDNEIKALSNYAKIVLNEIQKYPIVIDILRKNNRKEVKEYTKGFTKKEGDLLVIGFVNFDIDVNNIKFTLEKQEEYIIKEINNNLNI
jgi:hypothetical protein